MQRRMPRGDASQHGGGKAIGEMPGKFLQRLKRLDIYARPKKEFQRATLHGVVVSIVLAAAVVALTWRELKFSMRTETVESLFVNSTISPSFSVTFDVVFSRIACSMISLDAEDSSGVPQENVRHDVIRTRLDSDGRPLGEGEKHAMGNTLKEAIAKEEAGPSANPAVDKGGADAADVGQAQKRQDDDDDEDKDDDEDENECSCYGAGSAGECCRTCQDVRAAYRRKGWKVDPAAIPKCAGETGKGSVSTDSRGMKLDDSEGCRLAGSLEVTRTEGNFHFAPGHQLHRHANAMTFMDRVQVALENFNTTHTINSLTFGDYPLPRHASPKHVASSNVLEGHHKTVPDTHAMHQYFLQLVPTVYRLSDGVTVHSSQYSATQHLKHVHPGGSQSLPGVYFYYEVSPVQALVEENRRGFLAFLTGACGVVGGVYTILGLVNAGIDGLVSGGRRHRSR